MLLTRQADPSRHLFVISVLPHAAEVFHFTRAWGGWRKAHTGVVELADPLGQPAQLKDRLRQLCAPWGGVAHSRCAWVLPPDVLGVLALPAGPGLSGASLPFDLSEVRHAQLEAQAQDFKTLLWLHQDWMDPLERVTRELGWQLTDLYAQAQLWAALAGGKRPELVLQVQGRQATLHAQVQGRLVRATVLDDLGGAALERRVQAEWLSLQAGPAAPALSSAPVLQLVGGDDNLFASLPESWSLQRVPALDQGAALLALFKHTEGGIVLQAQVNPWPQKIKTLSAALGVLGGVVYGAMVWHDGELAQQTKTQNDWIKKQTPRYETLRQAQKDALYQSQYLAQLKNLQQVPPITTPLAALIAATPEPVILTSVDLEEKGFSLAGQGAAVEDVVTQVGKLPGFSNLKPREITRPDNLPKQVQVFGIDGVYAPPKPPAPEAPKGDAKPAGGAHAS